MSKEPPFLGKQCFGMDLRSYVNDSTQSLNQLNLAWVKEMYNNYPDKEHFFNSFFEKLAGTDELRQQIIAGKTESEIRSTWQDDLHKFKKIRKKYLLYR